MKKIILTIVFVFAVIGMGRAQDYNWAVGARIAGQTVGISGKYNLTPSSAVEGIFSYPWKNGFTVTGLYEITLPVISDGFNFYYGGGAHLGSWDRQFSFGVDAIVGLEYKVPALPLALSVDYKPVFNIVSDTKFYLLDFGLTVKYCF